MRAESLPKGEAMKCNARLVARNQRKYFDGPARHRLAEEFIGQLHLEDIQDHDGSSKPLHKESMRDGVPIVVVWYVGRCSFNRPCFHHPWMTEEE